MTLSGGTRARCVKRSVYDVVKAGLTTIGWFNSGRNHAPINLIPDRPDFSSNVTVPANTCALFVGGSESSQLELGSYSIQDEYQMWFEIYAEDDQLGIALSKDIQKILQGAYPGVNDVPTLILYDYTQSPAVNSGYLDICDVKFTHPDGNETWQRYWFKVMFCVTDYDYAG
jgi:hypothetical protein